MLYISLRCICHSIVVTGYISLCCVWNSVVVTLCISFGCFQKVLSQHFPSCSGVSLSYSSIVFMSSLLTDSYATGCSQRSYLPHPIQTGLHAVGFLSVHMTFYPRQIQNKHVILRHDSQSKARISVTTGVC